MLNQRGVHIAAQYSKGSATGRPGESDNSGKSGNEKTNRIKSNGYNNTSDIQRPTFSLMHRHSKHSHCRLNLLYYPFSAKSQLLANSL